MVLGSTPDVISYGMLVLFDSETAHKITEGSNENLEDQLNPLYYVIMPRFGTNLDTLFQSQKFKFSKEVIYTLGIQLINSLERIHNAGYVYNDLKLDNLLLDYKTDVKKLLK